MPQRFRKLTVAQFEALVKGFPWTRKIDAVHMHHTWRPNRQQYQGETTIEAMWRYHTQVNGWSDIAQHITIAPDGAIWTGRGWNTPPASASGHNGNRTAGPFMFEMIGDFDRGRDPFEDPQKETALRVIVALQKQFKLPPESLRFHSQMSANSCPGTAIDYAAFLKEVKARQTARRDASAEASDAAEERGFAPGELFELIDALRGSAPGDDPGEAEPQEGGLEDGFYDAEAAGERGLAFVAASRGEGVRGEEVTPEMLRLLRKHVINLSQGHLSDSGLFRSRQSEVEAIFQEHLPAALRAAEGAEALPLRIVFYAHGGLVSEQNALLTAYHQIQWWNENLRKNGDGSKKQYSVYPIYFVWETGFFETILQLLTRIQTRTQRAVRDIFDFTTDPILEAAARALQGATIWGGMKFSAEESSKPGGGAHLAAAQLAAFCNQAGAGNVEVHAVGHSAGAIFQAHFVPMAVAQGAPRFRRAYFMAPAIRVDTFESLLRQKVGPRGPNAAVDELVLYTMFRDVERDDNCAQIYRKSLLYLISNALERESQTPILGLEESIRANANLRALFGLGGPKGPGEIVFSPSDAVSGRRASTSTSHGGFDDDPPTMNSILRRVCDLDDNDPIFSFPRPAQRGLDDWTGQVDWPEELAFLRNGGAGEEPSETGPTRGAASVPRGGRRLALCVGINDYPAARLSGCVADAQLWARTLTRLGFEPPRTLFDRLATRDAILRELKALLGAGRPGDVVVFQYSGHGTQAPDVSGDEADGDTPDLDEAICPYDYAEGRLLIDDDLAEVFAATPEGVCVTCFIDCCHSGTITRFAAGGPAGAGSGERERWLQLTPAQQAAHVRFRRSLGGAHGVRKRGLEQMREVVFAACLSEEVALESNGQGHFSLRATGVIGEGVDGVTNRQFQQRVVQAFGSAPRQHPTLDCTPAAQDSALLGASSVRPTTTTVADAGESVGTGNGKPAGTTLDPSDRAALAHALRVAADALSRG
jgi:hypothetical protein